MRRLADAEFVAVLDYATTAFDVSRTVIRSAGERFPRSTVSLVVADLLDPPAEWRGAEVEAFAGSGLRVVGIELLTHPHDSGARRWVGEFRRSE